MVVAMSATKKRINAIRALLRSSIVAQSPEYRAIDAEFLDVVNVSKLRPENRRRLLQVLHSTRALDTTLKEYLRQSRINISDQKSLGAYLRLLSNPNRSLPPTLLPDRLKDRYQDLIVDERNRLMHKAGEFPGSEADVQKLLIEMNDCLTTVFRL